MELYEDYIKNSPLFNDLHELSHKELGCWCHPDKCHGDILVKLLNQSDIKLAIVGSRNFADKELFLDKLEEFIEKYGRPNMIISGGAKGADTLAEEYASVNKIDKLIFPAEWAKYGKMAGPKRNTTIIENCTHVLAFPSKSGSGTQDSINKGKKMDKIVEIHYID